MMKKYIKPALKTKAIVEEQLLAGLSAAINGGNPTNGGVSLTNGGTGNGSDAAAKLNIWDD